ncbi:uncharacterized protein I303_108478 [Kwoniella dejecticola CBS 10117]|uniref:Homeobox domain-containing protein n=1 Tax=Kwoniella dejecticola CBS 10117 TaxID=1296121 RepID=A0A1A5ZXA8_9TREE|nr:uncharacterized protein I303_07200 [Kwoniella dejecticola CBS 10117]OBR82440.1 hypothetical protein I303_07200 [Kwoniella dejecticola CBS 10117]
MSDSGYQVMALSPETSPQTPNITPSPPLRQLSMSVPLALSADGSSAIHASPVPPPRDIRALLSHSPPLTPRSCKSSSTSPDLKKLDKRSTASPSNFSRNLPPLTRTPPILPRPPIGLSLAGPSGNGRGTGIGLDAFRLGSPPKQHPQPGTATSHHHTRSFWVPSSTRNDQRSQHQRLASLPSIHTGHREKTVYRTPVCIASQRSFPMSTLTPVTQGEISSTISGRESAYQPPPHHRHQSLSYSSHTPLFQDEPVTHRRHPSSGDAVIRFASHPLHRPAWAAPPPPPAHAISIPGRTQTMARPRLQIHPYAPPRMDPRYYSAGGLGMQTHTHPGLAHGGHILGYGREIVFTSPSSGISPGSFKAPRKRADDSQLAILNDVFEKTAYPSTDERDELARKLGMTSRSVQIWFQNRRRAVKVDAQSAVQRAEAEVDTQLMIRGPAPNIPRPYPVHTRHRSESQEEVPLQPIVSAIDLSKERVFALFPTTRPPLVASQSDMVMVKSEVMTP